MSHWFTGWKLWPDRPKGPVGAAFRQVTWIRPYRPGPLRVAVAIIGIFVTVVPAFLAFSVLLSPGPVTARLVYGGAFGLIATGLAITFARFFAVGVYVNDAGVRILTMRAMAVHPWRLVTDVSTTPAKGRPEGTGDRVVITVRDTGPVATPVHRRSPDFLGRPEQFQMASLAIERWWRDAGRLGKASD
ncbi:MAG TPA: hypothetical protein VMX11_02685 [Actinomycetes bacterium]|nr:hypothetical protein [Actinomycetes bacterium]